ncbi:MAG TPA: oligopeptide transporter, OPT family [Fibrobacteria bacterium]|nr:oligopeptide transporter, OPT family [Fibrobacteria bacterium]
MAASGEFTVLSIGLGLAIALVMTAANVYLGLYAGMTVSASIPAAVLGMGAYRMLGKRDILGANIVQTLASSGESLAAGAIFTIPALVLVGAWQDFKFWPTTLITLSGGLLGIAFMVPLRRLLIVESPQLTYPEGVACAEVLRSGAGGAPGGVLYLVKGFLAGGLFKLGASGLALLSGTLEWAGRAGGRVFFFGGDLSPALLSVGFITGLEVSLQVFTGGVIAWVLGLPLLTPPEALAGAPALDAAWGLWSTQIRYLGVGAMVVGGLWSIFSIRKGILQGLGSLLLSYRSEKKDVPPARTERNMPGRVLLGLLAFCAALTFGVYWYLLKTPGLSLITTGLMMAAAFLLTGVSSYIVGLVGSSNNPVSGMTISALLGTAGFFLLLGFKGDSAILATLGVAAVVCCAACSAADCSQDLKTGYLVGSTPKYQQYAEVIGAVAPAFVIAPVLTLLHHSYTIGGGLKAPQATLFASLAGGIFGKGQIPVGMVGAGAAIGAGLIAADAWLKAKGSRFRLHPMPVAVGMYLPFTLSVPIFLGGLIRSLGQRSLGPEKAGRELGNAGVLLSSGLIAGESILGVVLAVFVYCKWPLAVTWHPAWLAWVSLAAFLALAAYLAKAGKKTLE